MATPLERFQNARSASELLIVGFYRGSWCIFCKAWMREWVQIPELATELKDLKAKLLFVSSQTQDSADEVATKWGFKALDSDAVEVVGDPDNTIPLYLKENGLLDVAVSGSSGYTTHGVYYEKGMVQPGCVAFKAGNSEPIYGWKLDPSTMNMGGAIDRVAPSKIWEYVKAVAAGEEGKKPTGETARYLKNMCTIC